MEIASNRLTVEQQKLWDKLYLEQRHLWAVHSPSDDIRDAFKSIHERVFVLSDVAIPGWQVYPVFGKLNEKDFFKLLSERKFPVNARMRDPEQLAYLAERDLWHDSCHIPYLYDPTISQFLAGLGVLWTIRNWQNNDTVTKLITKVYWATMEFGLVDKGGSVAVLGAAIMSSPDELRHVFSGNELDIRAFDLLDIATWDYPTETFQDRYYIIERRWQLLDILQQLWRI